MCRRYETNFKNINPSEITYDAYDKEERKYLINIYSPFFDIISKSGMLEYSFIISINMENIKNNNLQNEYISVFNNLNKSNIKYGAIKFKYYEESDLNLLKQFNLKFGQIKKFCIFDGRNGPNELNFDLFYKNLFSLDIKNNLIFLKIWHFYLASLTFEPELFYSINEFKSLRYLELSGIIFTKIFTLKLTGLNELYLYSVWNITFAQDIFINLRELNISSSNIIKPNILIKLPKIESFKYKHEAAVYLKKIILQDNSSLFDISSFSLIFSFDDADCLEKFHFKIISQINYDTFNNICKCVLNQPKLLSFKFSANVKEIDIDFYKNFIKNLLTMKLDKILIEVDKVNKEPIIYYSKEELKQIYPEIDDNDDEDEEENYIKIQKII